MGIMAYASALCWLCFLLLSSVEFSLQTLIPPDYFPDRPHLFPVWPQWHPEWAIALISATALLLFVPKFLSLGLILKNRQSRQFGGFLRLLVSVFLEIIVSSLLAPLRMWFHSKFVFLSLLGQQIKWTAQCRVGNATGWLEAARSHGFSSVLAAIWIGYMAWLNPTASLWALPVALPLLLSVPISVLSSHPALGSAIRRWRLLQIPAEYQPPLIITGLHDALGKREQAKPNVDGFSHAALDPFVHFVHVEMLRRRSPKPLKTKERNRTLRELALAHGPATLSRIERGYLLKDAESMTALHRQILQSVDSDAPHTWGVSLGACKQGYVNQTGIAGTVPRHLTRRSSGWSEWPPQVYDNR
jgi:membrane glycosyltransferase